MDTRLEALGAQRVQNRVDCDVDYEDSYNSWVEASLSAIAPAATAPLSSPSKTTSVAGTEFNKKNPFPAELLERAMLNGEGTAKETWHYELSLEGSGLSYQPGDVLAVLATNSPDMVAEILEAAKLTGSEKVQPKGFDEKPLSEALHKDVEITSLSRAILKKLHLVAPSDKLEALLSDDSKAELKDYVWGRWIADAIRDFSPDGLEAQQLIGLLRKLPPRLYSIASSPLAHQDEVHLTVASVRYQAHGKQRKGVASTYLADLVQTGDPISVYTQPNKNFRLPESNDTPIIMVGPGTGVAPFRAFVEHRAEQEAKGKSWLFFGDQRYSYDFLYQLEWQDHLKSGALTNLDVAFSRDQPEKVYVQHKMLERSKELYAWLQEGAHFYVCGDATRMANDVHEALLQIVATEGAMSAEAAEEFVAGLKKEKRYQRDVY